MAISTEDRITFLKQRPLFNSVEDDYLTEVAGRIDEFSQEPGKVIFKEGDPGNAFYLLYKGSVRVWGINIDEEEVDYGVLEAGDMIGEEALISGRPRGFNVTTLEDTLFFVIHRSDFENIIDTYPEVYDYLHSLMEARRQARELVFPWLHQGEIIQILTRRHPIRMLAAMVRPLVAALVGLFFLMIAGLTSLDTLPRLFGYAILGLAGIWAIWSWLDWRNDLFILTNQRVVWLEQVLFQAAARQEAPLAAVQSVDVKTSYLGRILDYGDVLVRTFTGTGSMKLTWVNRPKQMKREIEDLLLRVRKKTETFEEDMLRQSIRKSLGMEIETEAEDTVFHIAAPKEEPEPGFKLFRTREVSDDGKTITYHRHWWILLTSTWLPLLGFVTLIALLVYALKNSFVILGMQIPLNSFFFLWVLGILICAGIMGYNFLDWYNDIYKITKDDMLIDSEKKPLGEEISRSAPIKNIISLEHQRTGILRLLLNFGIVRVVVADEELIFYDVHNPAQVQQDIYYRQEQIKLRKEEADLEQDRAHISRWLRAYHEIQSEERASESQKFAADEDLEEDLD